MRLQKLLQLLLHLLRGLIRHQRDPTRPLAERGKALMHPLKKRQPLRLDTVLALTSPPQRSHRGRVPLASKAARIGASSWRSRQSRQHA